MTRPFANFAATLALGFGLAAGGLASAEDRPADKIIADIQAVEMPPRPAQIKTQAEFDTYNNAQLKAMGKKADLIAELAKAYPTNPQLATLLPQRWMFLRMKPETLPTLKGEVDSVIAKGGDEKMMTEAYYYKAMMSLMSAEADAKASDLLPPFEQFAEKFPKDPRVPSLLFGIASAIDDATAKEDLFKRLEKTYPGTPATRQVASARARAEGERKKLARVGKPFELEFTEATKGTQITMASLKGKVVVIDFWATWCGPCIAEMPNMKKLYAEFKDKGVEFIGVSLDQPKEKGGLDKLKDYVAKNDIQWPQYYQGNYWQSEFSSSWGVNSIPCVFLVDADGNLASINARGKLEKMIPEYLEKAKAKAGSTKTAAAP